MDTARLASGESRSWIGVPIHGADGVIGMLSAHRADGCDFTDDDEGLLTLLATLAGGALRETMLVEQAHDARHELLHREHRLSDVEAQAELAQRLAGRRDREPGGRAAPLRRRRPPGPLQPAGPGAGPGRRRRHQARGPLRGRRPGGGCARVLPRRERRSRRRRLGAARAGDAAGRQDRDAPGRRSHRPGEGEPDPRRRPADPGDRRHGAATHDGGAPGRESSGRGRSTTWRS